MYTVVVIERALLELAELLVYEPRRDQPTTLQTLRLDLSAAIQELDRVAEVRDLTFGDYTEEQRAILAAKLAPRLADLMNGKATA